MDLLQWLQSCSIIESCFCVPVIQEPLNDTSGGELTLWLKICVMCLLMIWSRLSSGTKCTLTFVHFLSFIPRPIHFPRWKNATRIPLQCWAQHKDTVPVKFSSLCCLIAEDVFPASEGWDPGWWDLLPSWNVCLTCFLRCAGQVRRLQCWRAQNRVPSEWQASTSEVNLLFHYL